nr:hypothetical protein [Candidatus Sigynarchaeota archaeon]
TWSSLVYKSKFLYHVSTMPLSKGTPAWIDFEHSNRQGAWNGGRANPAMARKVNKCYTQH